MAASPGQRAHERAVTPWWLGHRPPSRAGAVGRPPRPLHAQRMQPPPRAPYPLAVGPKGKSFPLLPAAIVELSPTLLCLLPRLCSFIATPLSLMLPTPGQVNDRRACMSSASPAFLYHGQLLVDRSPPAKSTPFATSPSTTAPRGTSPTSQSPLTSAPLATHRRSSMLHACHHE
jgi:hypothetical protein